MRRGTEWGYLDNTKLFMFVHVANHDRFMKYQLISVWLLVTQIEQW